ncbi:MAG: gamma-glutamyl-gamma-aminobutyrate hydrolase family protein [Anaeroplasma sp.]
MKIGIVLRSENEKLYVNKSYLLFINSLNCDYTFIDDCSDLSCIDMFILPGGYDINPIYYNEKNTNSKKIDMYNDFLDFKVIKYALENNIPLLGICRGMQSIVVSLGGSLHQNIDKHMNNNHFIIIDEKYYLVNSYHHQAIKKLPSGISVLAKSIDGNIEIIKYKNLLGIQFHPEKLYSLSSFNLKLSHWVSLLY